MIQVYEQRVFIQPKRGVFAGFWLDKEGFYWLWKIITLDFFDFWQIITLDNFIFLA